MSHAIVRSRASLGISAPLVQAEIDISPGLPRLNIVGLPETAVRESKDRVRSAILNSHLSFPSRRITINLAPADLPKSGGGRFDLAIALGILVASNQVPPEPLAQNECIAELALSGDLRPVSAVLPASLQCGRERKGLIVATSNAPEAALSRHTQVLPASHLLEVCAHLNGRQAIEPSKPRLLAHFAAERQNSTLQSVRGQLHAKRAIEIAAAGSHNLLMCGPPGSGKTLLASCLPELLPQLNEEEIIEIATIRSLRGGFVEAIKDLRRPFRSPHHSASAAALVGGGNPPQPGEISLAHNGVLFLDELPEFQRRTLEMLREPMEAGTITLSRAAHQCNYPSRFQLVAAMNPCPCGYLGDREKECQCSGTQIQRYRKCISGPLLDRIDIHLEVPRLKPDELIRSAPQNPPNSEAAKRVAAARQRRINASGLPSALLSQTQVEQACQLDDAQKRRLGKAVEQLQLSGRAFFRVLRVALTISDLGGEERVSDNAINEALNYRPSLP